MRATKSAKKESGFDPKKFLATIGEGRKVVAFPVSLNPLLPRSHSSPMAYGTRNDTLLKSAPLGVTTWTSPVVAPAGTVVMISELDTTVTGTLIGKCVGI